MKRFTDTDKWRDPWFRKLSSGVKLAFLFIVDNCDNAGVWDADMELADFSIGMEIPWQKVRDALGDRMEVLNSGKWHLKKFVNFQFGKLSEECKPHAAVIRLLQKHEIERVSKEYPKGIHTLKDKDKDQDKDKDKKGDARGKPESREAARAYGAEIGMTADAVDSWFDHFESNGWKVSGKSAMKNWQAGLRNGKRMAEKFAPTKSNGTAPPRQMTADDHAEQERRKAACDKAAREQAEELHRMLEEANRPPCAPGELEEIFEA
jgi:hypothetical protein